MASSEWRMGVLRRPLIQSLFATPYSLFAIRLSSRRLGGELLALLDRRLDGADHVEGGLGQVVVLAFAQALEAADGIGEIDEHAGRAGEHLGDMEGLRQEALDLARARHRDLV